MQVFDKIISAVLIAAIFLSGATSGIYGTVVTSLSKDIYCNKLEAEYVESQVKNEVEKTEEKVAMYKGLNTPNRVIMDKLDITADESKYSVGKYKIQCLNNYCTFRVPTSHLTIDESVSNDRCKVYNYKKDNEKVSIYAETNIKIQTNLADYIMNKAGINSSSSISYTNTINYLSFKVIEDASSGTAVYYYSVSGSKDAIYIITKSKSTKDAELTAVISSILSSLNILVSNTVEDYVDSSSNTKNNNAESIKKDSITEINSNESDELVDKEQTDGSNESSIGTVEKRNLFSDIQSIKIEGSTFNIPYKLSDMLDNKYVLSSCKRFDTIKVNSIKSVIMTTPSSNNIKANIKNNTKLKGAIYNSIVYGLVINTQNWNCVPDISISNVIKFGDSRDSLISTYGKPNIINENSNYIVYVDSDSNFEVKMYFGTNGLYQLEVIKHFI